MPPGKHRNVKLIYVLVTKESGYTHFKFFNCFRLFLYLISDQPQLDFFLYLSACVFYLVVPELIPVSGMYYYSFSLYLRPQWKLHPSFNLWQISFITC